MQHNHIILNILLLLFFHYTSGCRKGNVSLSVDWSLSAPLWSRLKYVNYLTNGWIHGLQRVHPNDFGDSLTYPVTQVDICGLQFMSFGRHIRVPLWKNCHNFGGLLDTTRFGLLDGAEAAQRAALGGLRCFA